MGGHEAPDSPVPVRMEVPVMGLFDKADPAAVREYKAAKAALDKLPTRDKPDAEYLRANKDAARKLPWYRR
ncbi:hypothetical protein [Actinocatenispora rupis]|uniref:hypothetical protein n=1 Tax=Actinocatenispora rupis TaxID=519421 RepID=UPI0019446A8D|nr:hypothetical protein [Actinocatenispora rupis]